MKITSEYNAFGQLHSYCVARKGIGSYFCQGQCIYNQGTEHNKEKNTFTVECANPKQKPQKVKP